MPPTVNTDFAKDIGGAEHGMSPVEVATDLVNGLANDTFEIYTGMTGQYRELYFSDPKGAFAMMNKD